MLKTINFKDVGHIESSLAILNMEIENSKKEGISILKLIHGYGSSGQGGFTLKAIRKNENTKYMPVIMITAVSEEHKIVSGLKHGADDYIVKPFVLPNLLARIEAVIRRSKWQLEKSNSKKDFQIEMKDDIEPLTEREKEVLTLVAQGKSNQDIAEMLFVRDVTVKTHLNTIYKKLKVKSRTQAILLAMQMNILS